MRGMHGMHEYFSIGSITSKIGNGIKSGGGDVKNVATNVGGDVKNTATTVGGKIKDVASKVGGFLKTVFVKIWEWIKKLKWLVVIACVLSASSSLSFVSTPVRAFFFATKTTTRAIGSAARAVSAA